ncbi:hypothetical protein CR513_60489, partial [Mucuna pruriens]
MEISKNSFQHSTLRTRYILTKELFWFNIHKGPRSTMCTREGSINVKREDVIGCLVGSEGRVIQQGEMNSVAPLFQVQTDDWECFCAIHWDPSHADCAVPQELETDQVLKQLKYIEMIQRNSDNHRKEANFT